MMTHREALEVVAANRRERVVVATMGSVGLWPASRPDPLGDYLAALERTIELAPTSAYGGHGDPVSGPAASK